MLDTEGTNGKVAMKPIIYSQTWRIGIHLFHGGLLLASDSLSLLDMIMSDGEFLVQELFFLLLGTV